MTGDYRRDVHPVPLAKGRALPYVALHGKDTKLRRAIAAIGWPSYAVGAAAGINPKTMSAYLNAKERIRPHHMVRLTTVLNCDAEDLLEEEM
jgi:hypothetical protein